MTERFRTRAYVLEARDYRESSLLLGLLTEERGPVRLVARGVRSQKKTSERAIDLFARGECVFSLRASSDLGTLILWETEEQHSGLRHSLVGYAFAAFWGETVLAILPPLEPAKDVFELSCSFFHVLEGGLPTAQGVAHHFLRLLAVEGFEISVDRCVACGAKAPLAYFSWDRLASLCAKCIAPTERAFPLDPHVSLALAEASRVPEQGPLIPKESQSKSLLSLAVFTEELIRRLCDTRLRTAPFLRDVLAKQSSEE
ncbi:MAG: DNA repair protein RecO [Candidatus Hydrogenedentota bacterium]|uniref:DNA repair protein RecO n=1 Tax=Sumerlaea chitinivorans TaxID=2250252 RepID=A0A2Z4Y2S1_SUMC1|nr:DNA recombination and repair protein RecO [Candidatus Sumerlaea chitinivorans]RMH30181.1 MAG: DNA repair protein RecO [Candidatus Hydrogenedentota bacterium]GIX44526.1 MAG: hypothetical protein KatS3mg130_0934 [Candidatus Sumerlaea sp.]